MLILVLAGTSKQFHEFPRHFHEFPRYFHGVVLMCSELTPGLLRAASNLLQASPAPSRPALTSEHRSGTGGACFLDPLAGLGCGEHP